MAENDTIKHEHVSDLLFGSVAQLTEHILRQYSPDTFDAELSTLNMHLQKVEHELAQKINSHKFDLIHLTQSIFDTQCELSEALSSVSNMRKLLHGHMADIQKKVLESKMLEKKQVLVCIYVFCVNYR